MFLPLHVILEFAKKYKEQFDIPLFVTGIIPASIDERKFHALIDAGMIKARIGEMADYRKLLGDILLQLPGAVQSKSYVVMEEIKETLTIAVGE